MELLEPIIAAAIGAAATGLTMQINKTRGARLLLRYGPLVQKAYNIIDPVLDQNLHGWKGSQVDTAFELAIQTVADGKLTPGEVRTLAFEMAKAWLPQKAADKVRRFERSSKFVPEMQIAANIAERVNSLPF
jgi:hypothetical protein